MAKYAHYIELSPGFESYVDASIDERNPEYWKNYIVHDDMAKALDAICRTFKPQGDDDKRSFWIHGTYGTGKSYSALVIKHLFKEPISEILSFLSRQKLLDYKAKFLSIRERGEYLVIWKSGTTAITNGLTLMMEIELAIREELIKQYKGKAYLGTSSIIDSVRRILNDQSHNWDYIFANSQELEANYSSLEDLRARVESGNIKACEIVASIVREKGWGLFNSVDEFKEWIRDIINGNNLDRTGIIFIWDEFTRFLSNSKDSDILQTLSEYCKQQPFYMMLIVHRDPSFIANIGEATYKKIMDRYHDLEFSISENAAFQMVGDTIRVRPGYEEEWKEIQDRLVRPIRNIIPNFFDMELGNEIDMVKQLCPIHPITVALLTKVAGNFGAAERTIFRFLKDNDDDNEKFGFTHYINNYSPDDWKWLTADFLWDYFFLRNSDVRNFGEEARLCQKHYFNNINQIQSDKNAVRIFKTALLLISVMGSTGISYIKQKDSVNRRLKASVSSLASCFEGQLDKADVERYIKHFQESRLILTTQDRDDMRLERPYENTDGEDTKQRRIEEEKKKNSVHTLLGKDGVFFKELSKQVQADSKSVIKRLEFAFSTSEISSFNIRFDELKGKIDKYPYKFGILSVIPKDREGQVKISDRIKEISSSIDNHQRIAFVVLRTHLNDEPDSELDRWYSCKVDQALAMSSGSKASADRAQKEADLIVTSWASKALNSEMTAFYGSIEYQNIYNKSHLFEKVERNMVFSVFPSAPERVFRAPATLYKASAIKSALPAIKRDKEVAAQYKQMVTQLESIKAWDETSLTELSKLTGTDSAQAVAELAKFINIKLSTSSVVKLDLLWEELQKPPFGYYDTIACSYLLGFVLKTLINTDYNWNDGTNPNILTEETLSTMISRMCRNDVDNNYISAGSEIDRQFRELILKQYFDLSPEEVVNIETARRNLRAKVNTKIGLPFWMLKYLPDHEFGSQEYKETMGNALDNVTLFIQGEVDQDSVMKETIELLKGKGPLRKNFTSIISNSSKLFSSLKLFISNTIPSIDEHLAQIGFSDSQLIAELKSLLQGEVYTWQEKEVISEMKNFSRNLKLISYLNMILKTQKKSVIEQKNDLTNRFKLMKVPGEVMILVNEDWSTALKALRQIEQGSWKELTGKEKDDILDILQEKGKDAWLALIDSRLVLSKYLVRQGFDHIAEDVDTIYRALPENPYDTTEISFRTVVMDQRRKLVYERSKEELLSLWKRQSNASSTKQWSIDNEIPLEWVTKPEHHWIINLISEIEQKRLIDPSKLAEALHILKNETVIDKYDEEYLRIKFFEHINKRYINIQIDRKREIIPFIVKEIGKETFEWNKVTLEVQEAMDKFLREDKNAKQRIVEFAKEKLLRMSDAELRRKLSRLLSQNPDICILLLEEENDRQS